MSSRRTWAQWAALARSRYLRASERRQARKAWGRESGMEWRSLGRQDRGVPGDALTQQILTNRAERTQ